MDKVTHQVYGLKTLKRLIFGVCVHNPECIKGHVTSHKIDILDSILCRPAGTLKAPCAKYVSTLMQIHDYK